MRTTRIAGCTAGDWPTARIQYSEAGLRASGRLCAPEGRADNASRFAVAGGWDAAGSLAADGRRSLPRRASRLRQMHAPAASRHGSDWPGFLGPTGDSKSTERGILTGGPRGAAARLAACRWAPATACRRSAAAGCFNSTARRPGPAAMPGQRDRQAAVDVRIPQRFQDLVRLRQRPALLAGGRRRPRLHLRRRGNAALPGRGRRQAASGRSTRRPSSA